MEFWSENQGQSPLYSKFGTVPGRNCTHNYHDRYQVPHYPLHYGKQQDQDRESRYWSVPGSRTGGAPQEYTNWTDQELAAPSSSHFPFILDRHTQQHQDLGDREWTAAQRAAKEYERGFLREGWQRGWEHGGPVRYNREVSATRSDSSYRELEAWAARYSHSLPRRRRIEAELRGASQGLLESSRPPERDSRSGTDSRLAALQQVRQSANIRQSGLGCARGGRQQAPTYYPSQTPATDTSHMLDMKEKADYQRRMFSQPPGYIAPPPYDSPHKGSPVLHCDTSWEDKGKRQPNWSQTKLRKQGGSADLCDHKKGEKEEFTKQDGNQKGFLALEGLMHRRQETDALQASIPFSIQEKHIEREDVLYVQQQQVLQTVENKKINEELSPKVIEGREFRLNKKTGGMTIFCLVSRIAGTTETPSLPPSTLQTNTVLGGFPKSLRSSSGINQTHKLADEVDFRAPTLTEPQNTSHGRNVKAKQKETPTCVESEMREVSLSETAETDIVSPEKANTSDADSTFGRIVAQPVAVKYPLWREPSITSRAETESSSPCLKANTEEGESDVLQDQERKTHAIEVEVRRLDIKPDTESEDNKGLLVIDTTCIVIKMELIPSFKKEHVHNLHTKHSQLDTQTTVSPECVQSNSQLNQEETTDQNTETNPHCINERPETKLDSDRMEKKAHKGQSEISSCCMSSSPVSKREMLEERAERILGIPLHDCIAKQQPEDAASLLDSCVEDREVEPSPIKDNDIEDAVEQIQEETSKEEQLQSQLEVGQTEDTVCLQENDETKDQTANESGGDVAGHQDQVSNMSEEKDIVSQLKTDLKTSPELEMNEDPLLKPTSEEGSTEQEENDTSSHHSQCLSPPTNLSDSSSFSPSPHCEAPTLDLSVWPSSSDLTPLLHISESNKEEGPDTELIALNSAENLAPHLTSSLPHTPPLLHSGSTSSTLHTDHSPRHSSLDFIVVEDHDEEGETSHVINNETSEAFAKDMTEELVSQQQFASGQTDNAACVKKSNVTDAQHTKEADKDPIDHIIEQTLNIAIEDANEVDILLQQFECVHAEEVACVKESYVTEEQRPKEDKDLLEQTISQEKVSDSQTQTGVNILLQQFDNEEESFMTEKQSNQEVDEEQHLSTENATDPQTQTGIDTLQDVEPQTEPSNSSPPSSSESDCEVFQSPLDVLSPCDLSSPPHTSNESDAEFFSLLPSVCPLALNYDADPAAGIHGTDPPFLYLDSCEESLQFPSSSCTDSPPVLRSSSSTPPPQEEGEDVDPELLLKEEPQYPMALWDAVNRIRKHTAPDSENEEEEVNELWDPESVGEDVRCLGVVEGMDSERIVFDGAGQRAVSTEESVEDDVEFGQIQEDSCYEEPGGHAEEDTLSCSSTSSHGSGDTVIVADEDEVEETPPDAWTESMAGNDEEFQAAEGEQCCDAEVKDETAAKGEGDRDGDESQSQSEDCQVEVTNKTTTAAEMAETEREENEQVVLMPSTVSDERMIEIESTG